MAVATAALVVSELVNLGITAINNYRKQKDLRDDARREADLIARDMAALKKLNMRIPQQRAEALKRLGDIMNKYKTDAVNVITGAVKKTQEELGDSFNAAIGQTIQQTTQQGLGGSQAQQEAVRKNLSQLSEQQLEAGESGQEQITKALSNIGTQQSLQENEIINRFNQLENIGARELLKLGSAQRRQGRYANEPTDWWSVFLGGGGAGAIGDLIGSGTEYIAGKFFGKDS